MPDPTGDHTNPNAWYAERQRAWATAWEQAMRHAIEINDSAEQHQPTPLEETPCPSTPTAPPSTSQARKRSQGCPSSNHPQTT